MIVSLGETSFDRGFFSQFLEYTPLNPEKKILSRHMPRVKTVEADLRRSMLDFGEELMAACWPQTQGKSVRLDELVSMGLPAKEPDIVDYL